MRVRFTNWITVFDNTVTPHLKSSNLQYDIQVFHLHSEITFSLILLAVIALKLSVLLVILIH